MSDTRVGRADLGDSRTVGDELKAKFGSDSIGSPDETIAKRVLIRGSSATNEEGQAIRDLLSLPEEVLTRTGDEATGEQRV